MDNTGFEFYYGFITSGLDAVHSQMHNCLAIRCVSLFLEAKANNVLFPRDVNHHCSRVLIIKGPGSNIWRRAEQPFGEVAISSI